MLVSSEKRLPRRPNKPKAELDGLVREVFEEIERRGDAALLDYTLKFDKVALSSPEVDEKTIAESERRLPTELKNAIVQAAANIRKFHESQTERPQPVETVPGVLCWRESRPIERVGIYVPGGSAPLFSTVLMLAVPAKIAGCRETILCTPPGTDGGVHQIGRAHV